MWIESVKLKIAEYRCFIYMFFLKSNLTFDLSFKKHRKVAKGCLPKNEKEI